MPRRPINQYDILPGSLTGMVVAQSIDANTTPASAQQGIMLTEYKTFLEPTAIPPLQQVDFTPGTKVRIVDVSIYSMNGALAPNFADSVSVFKLNGSGAPPVTLFTVSVGAAPVIGQVVRADSTLSTDSIDPDADDQIRVYCAAWIAGGVTVRVQFEAIP